MKIGASKNKKIFFFCFGSLIFLANFLFFLKAQAGVPVVSNSAPAFFTDSASAADLRKKYSESAIKVKILIVPGHEPDSGGAEFGKLKERDFNLVLAKDLNNFLQTDGKFEVVLSRNDKGFNPVISDYLDKNKTAIEKFIEEQRNKMGGLVEAGQVSLADGVNHNFAKPEVATELFGINKWANENGVDILIHLHVNDYAGRKNNKAGKYNGFSIYVPEKQFSNSKASIALAESISGQLSQILEKSNLPKEGGGVVEDQELIAIGSNNSLKSPSLVIEYGYIYEQQYKNEAIRNVIFNELAYRTYLGIHNFFGDVGKDFGEFSFQSLPYQWQKTLKKGLVFNRDVLELQFALADEGLFPTYGKDKRDCRFNGIFGDCTAAAVKNFQKRYAISPASGFVGGLTLKKLNSLYGKK